MNHKNDSFVGIRQIPIFNQSWLPDGKPKAGLLIVHGLGEHSSRYGNVINHLNPLGYACYALDHIGHGKSGGEREFVQRFEDFTDNLAVYHRMVRESQPDLPLFLLGHSLGGLIASFYLLDHQADFKGAILSAPAVKISDSVTSSTILLSKVLSKLAPRAGVLALNTQHLSHDPAVVQAYEADPLVYHGKTPARLGAEILRAMQRVTAEAGTLRLPLLLVQGGDDHIVDPGGAAMLYEKTSAKDKTIKVYPGLYHEIFNEPERAQVLADVASWLESR